MKASLRVEQVEIEIEGETNDLAGGWAQQSKGGALHYFPSGCLLSACKKAVRTPSTATKRSPASTLRRCAQCRDRAVVRREAQS